MALALPHAFADGPGNTASGVQVTENDAAVRDAVNAEAGTWRTFLVMGGRVPASLASSIGLVLQTDFTSDLIAAGGAHAAHAIRLDSADLARSSMTAKLRIRATLFVNAVATVANHTVNLGAVSAWGGASGSAPIISTLSGTVVSTPNLSSAAASGPVTQVSPEVSWPTAGYYALWLNTGAISAGGIYMIRAELQRRWV